MREERRKFDLSVIGPAYNENNNIIELVERLQKVFDKKKVNGEIVLIDDASTDETSTIMDVLSSKFRNIVVIHNQQNLGIAKSWGVGLEHASGQYVSLIDTDLQNLPEDVWRLYQEIMFTNADMVQGYRNHVGKTRLNGRYFLSRGLNFLLNFIFRMNLRDNKSGFVICRREVMFDILKHKKKYHHFQTFITVAAKAKNYSIREIETLFGERRVGESYLTSNLFMVGWQTFTDILKAFFEFRILDWYDTTLHDFNNLHALVKTDSPLKKWRKLLFQVYCAMFPFHHWMISYNAVGYYKELKKSQWLSKDDIKTYQELRLRQLIQHAYYHVPFYRDLFDKNNIKPDDIQHVEDLHKIPIIDKQVVRDNLYLGMLSNNHDKKKIQKVQTSGSTGEPFVTYAEKKQLEMRWAATQRSLEWTGYRFGDRQVRLWHKHLGMKPTEVFRERLDALFTRRRFIPAYEITNENLRDYVQRAMKYEPAILDGYAESFNFLARFLKQNEYFGHKPKGIMSSAQTLPDESRKIIEECFQCGVYDKYGAREFAGGVAYQCSERHGYHVVAECNIVEIIKDGMPAKPGEVGEVIITELNNFAMPLIRYRVGDLATQLDFEYDCPCGRGLPLIGAIQGRRQSIIVGTKNQFVPGTFFNRVFFKHDLAIHQYQVVQEKFGELRLRIIKGNLFTEKVLSEVFRDIKQHLGEDLVIHVEYVNEIPMGRTGKRHYCISYLDPLAATQDHSQ